MDILIGALASLIASIIWWAASELYSFNARKRVEYKLMLLRNDNYDYQKYLRYKDYNLALHQVQRMLDEIGDLVSYIKLLTYSHKKKKLIFTLLNSMYYTLSHFQRYNDGYDEKETEKEVCCEKAKKELYVVGYKLYKDNYESLTEVIIELLSELNQRKHYKKVLRSAYCFNGNRNIEERKTLYKDLININSYKDSFSKEVANKFFLTTSGFTREQYEKIIDKL